MADLVVRRGSSEDARERARAAIHLHALALWQHTGPSPAPMLLPGARRTTDDGPRRRWSGARQETRDTGVAGPLLSCPSCGCRGRTGPRRAKETTGSPSASVPAMAPSPPFRLRPLGPCVRWPSGSGAPRAKWEVGTTSSMPRPRLGVLLVATPHHALPTHPTQGSFLFCSPTSSLRLCAMPPHLGSSSRSRPRPAPSYLADLHTLLTGQSPYNDTRIGLAKGLVLRSVPVKLARDPGSTLPLRIRPAMVVLTALVLVFLGVLG